MGFRGRAQHIGLAVASLVGACTEAVPSATFHISAKPAVYDASALQIDVTVDGASTTRTFPISAFPQSFSITSTTAQDHINVKVAALRDSLVVGQAEASATLGGAVTLELLPTDFVVNHTTEGMQELVNERDLNVGGAQLVPHPDGTFDVQFADGCDSDVCNYFVRRFSRDGRPVAMAASKGLDHEWRMASAKALSAPRVAPTLINNLLTLYWYEREFDGPSSLHCRRLGPDGALTQQPTMLAQLERPFDLAVAALTQSRTLVAWRNSSNGDRIDMAVHNEQCERLTSVSRVAATSSGSDLGAVYTAVRSDQFIVAWYVYEARTFYFRRYALDGSPLETEPRSLTLPVDNFAGGMRIMPLGDGWGIPFIRYRSNGQTGTVALIRVSNLGYPDPNLIELDGSAEFDHGSLSYAATGPNQPVVLAWSSCAVPVAPCDTEVYTQVVLPSGQPLGPRTQVNSTTHAGQRYPSIGWLGDDAFAVAYTDESGAAPDTSSKGVRARIIFPTLQREDGAMGATCDASHPCASPLLCATQRNGESRCAHACDALGGCPQGGLCRTNACVF